MIQAEYSLTYIRLTKLTQTGSLIKLEVDLWILSSARLNRYASEQSGGF